MNIYFYFPVLILSLRLSNAKENDVNEDSSQTTQRINNETNNDNESLENVHLDLVNEQDQILIDGSMKKETTEENAQMSIEEFTSTKDVEAFHGEDLAVRRKGGVRRKLISSNKVNVSRLENKAQTVVPVTTMSGKSPEEKPVINENVTTNIRKDVGSTNIPGTNGDGLPNEVSVPTRIKRITEESADSSSLKREASTEPSSPKNNSSTVSSLEYIYSSLFRSTDSMAINSTRVDEEPLWRNRQTTNVNSSFRNRIANMIEDSSNDNKDPMIIGKQPMIQIDASDVRNKQTMLINNVQKLENKINNISNVLTDLQNSLKEKFADTNEQAKRVSKLLSHDDKINLHDMLKPKQDSALHLNQTMEIAIQLTDLRGNAQNLSNHKKINVRPPEKNPSLISNLNLQSRKDTISRPPKMQFPAEPRVCPEGTSRKI